MKVNNTLVGKPQEKQTFQSFINSEKVKNTIVDRLGGDIQLASRLIATVSSVVAENDKLRNCDYGSIVREVLKGEVGMNLSLALGQYAIIPYGSVAKYQIMVSGLKQLCIRSKAYANIGCFDVREGEYKGRDPRTRDPIFKWVENDDERLNLPIVGYYAFYMLNEENNNFFRCIYWTHEQILRHADRYSPGFDLETYRKLLAGELPPEEVEKLQGTKKKKGSSPWYAAPDDMPHMKMCEKTVLKQLLNDGLAPKSIQEVIAEDDYTERHEAPVIHGDDVFFSDDAPIIPTDSNGEIIEAEAVTAEPQEVSAPVEVNAAPSSESEKSVKPRRTRSRVADAAIDDSGDADGFAENFFGE